MYLLFVLALFNVCHSYVINDVHYRSLNGSGFVLDDDVDLSELSEEEIAMLRFSLIYPGTKWCGPGDTADNYEDLGVAEAEDRCCRQHDYCPDTIVSGETKNNLTNDSYYTRLVPQLLCVTAVVMDCCCRQHNYCPDTIVSGETKNNLINDGYYTGSSFPMKEKQPSPLPDTIIDGETKNNLTNDGYYTRLSCDCDEIFRQCMRKADTKNSKTIGTVYFNVIGTQCFRKDYPVTGCLQKGGWLMSKCVEYSYDKTGMKIYQWFDLPNYYD